MAPGDEWRIRAGPWARAVLPDGQEVDVIVSARERTADGRWWYLCDVLLPDRRQEPDGATRPTAAPTPIIVSAEALTPIPGEDYAALPTTGAVAGRQWLLARVALPSGSGPGWRLHRRDCWQATGDVRRLTTAQAREALEHRTAQLCEVCRPERALPRRLPAPARGLTRPMGPPSAEVADPGRSTTWSTDLAESRTRSLLLHRAHRTHAAHIRLRGGEGRSQSRRLCSPEKRAPTGNVRPRCHLGLPPAPYGFFHLPGMTVESPMTLRRGSYRDQGGTVIVEQNAGWDDILVRDNFRDQGQTPTPDPMWQSPDIIPFGSDILDFDLLESSYNGPDLGVLHPIVHGALNRIYVRGKSLRDGCPASGDVRLYFAPGGLVLDPRAWKSINAETGDATAPFVARGGSRLIAPGQICVSRTAFVLPSQTPPGHYCLIATSDTPAHPMPPHLPAFNSNVDYVRWVKYNPDVAWRNIDVIPCEQRRYVLSNLAVSNMNDTPTKYVFGVSGTKLPDGTAVFSSTDQRLPFTLPPVQIYAPGDEESYSRSVTLPANYSGTVTVVIEFDRPLPCDATIVLRAYNPVTSSPGTLESRLAAPLTGVPEAAADGQFILLGEYTFATPPNDG